MKGTQQELLELKAKNAQSSEEEDRVETLMAALRTFGRFPREHTVTEDPKLEEERKLAHDIRKKGTRRGAPNVRFRVGARSYAGQGQRKDV